MSGEVDSLVIEKVNRLAAEIQIKNAVGANAIQMVIFVTFCSAEYSDFYFFYFNYQDLVTNDWGAHKDWIKGLKILIQVTTKK